MEKTNLELKKEILEKQLELMQKPSGTISLAGDLDAIERKFYNKLLRNVDTQLKDDINRISFSISLKWLKSVLNISENDKHNNYYKKLLRRLYETSVAYNILEKDKIITGTAHLIDNLDYQINKETQELMVLYTVPLIIRRAILNVIQGNPEALYAKINLAIIKGLKSKYSIILYELCKDYQNVKIPEMSIQQFKKLFGIENKIAYNNSSTSIRNIKERILNLAVNELNENSNVEFTVSYELIKTANFYTSIKFNMKSKPKPKQKILEEYRDTSQLKILLNVVPQEERTKPLEDYLAKCLKSDDAKYLLHQIEYVTQQKPKSFFAYLKKAIEEDYAKAELAEEQEKAEKERIERLIQKELERLKKEKLDLIDAAVDREKNKIYEEYLSFLKDHEKEKLFEEYKEKTKELYHDIQEGSFLFEERMKRLIAEDVVLKNEIYQKRLEKICDEVEEKAERAYQREKAKLREKIENGETILPLMLY
jgi:hypothetical protein